jgi:hypothetical protein
MSLFKAERSKAGIKVVTRKKQYHRRNERTIPLFQAFRKRGIEERFHPEALLQV